MDGDSSQSGGKCPVMHGGLEKNAVVLEMSNQIWWPNHLNLKILHQHSPKSDPMGEAFDYAEEFKTLDLNAVIARPACADDGLTGLVAGRFRALRAGCSSAWRGTAAGTYRIADGRGGAGRWHAALCAAQ